MSLDETPSQERAQRKERARLQGAKFKREWKSTRRFMSLACTVILLCILGTILLLTSRRQAATPNSWRPDKALEPKEALMGQDER